MPVDIPGSPSLVLVLCVIGHAACSKWNCLCLAIRHLKNSVPLLQFVMRPAQSLQLHYVAGAFC